MPLPEVFHLVSLYETTNYNKILLHLKTIFPYKKKNYHSNKTKNWMEIIGSFRIRDKLSDQLQIREAWFFSLFWRRPLYIMSIQFRQQMASLQYTNLTGFFREVDEQKENKVMRPALPDMNNYYKAMIIKAV